MAGETWATRPGGFGQPGGTQAAGHAMGAPASGKSLAGAAVYIASASALLSVLLVSPPRSTHWSRPFLTPPLPAESWRSMDRRQWR